MIDLSALTAALDRVIDPVSGLGLFASSRASARHADGVVDAVIDVGGIPPALRDDIENQVRAYATQVTARAEGEAAQFDAVYAQYKLSPEVTRRRMYYETMEKVLSKTDKTVVEPRGVVPYVMPPAKPEQPQEPAK